MVSFHDGPAAGKTLLLRRAPMFLRVVVNAAGKIDALDQLDDHPAGDELVYVYRKRADGIRGRVHIRPGGCYEMGDYDHMSEVDGEQLRDFATWRSWAQSQ